MADEIPVLEALPGTNGRALADAWRMEPQGDSRVDDLDQVVPMLKARLLGTDTLEIAVAIACVERLIVWLKNTTTSQMRGRLESPSEAGLAIETLYFDGPRVGDWPAFGYDDHRLALALGRSLVFMPSGESDVTMPCR